MHIKENEKIDLEFANNKLYDLAQQSSVLGLQRYPACDGQHAIKM
jgi:hypothetical protein